jgi:hypothetical protein
MLTNCTLPAYLRNPRLRFIDPPEGGGGGGGDNPPAAKPNFSDERGKTWEFPAETPVKDMTADQAKEYWRYQAKKHERNRKPDDFDQVKADADAFRAQKNQPPKPGDGDDPAAVAAAARTEGVTEGRNAGVRATLPTLLELAIRSKNPDIDDDDVESIIDDLDLNKFITTGGDIDSARVQKLAEKHAVKADSTIAGAPGDPLAAALAHNQQQPGGSSTAGGSVASLREQARERIQPSKKS